MSQQEVWDELQEMKRKANKAKMQIAEIKTQGTDPIQSYARDMPNSPSKYRSWAFDLVVEGVSEPACPEEVIQGILCIYDAEGVMSRFLAKPDTFWDPHYEGEYDVLYGQKEPGGLNDYDTGEQESA